MDALAERLANCTATSSGLPSSLLRLCSPDFRELLSANGARHTSKPLIVHIHGAFFFAWTGLLNLQAILAATKLLRLHRTVGSIAGWLVLSMLALGTIVATPDTVHGFRAGDGDSAFIMANWPI